MSGVSLYFAGGFATAPNFMTEFGEAIRRQYEHSGVAATANYVFPYGDWNSSRWKQLGEIQRDLARGRLDWLRSVGGNRLVEMVKKDQLPRDQHTVLIGHSAGGLSCVHAARMLLNHFHFKLNVVQIGSPKCPVPDALREASMYIYAVDRYGRKKDAVTRLGRWGRFKPGTVQGISIIGGHKDYFRNGPPFADTQGRTNLEYVAGNVCSWLLSR